MIAKRKSSGGGFILASAIVVISAGYVLTPLLVKSIIDGFVPTQDQKALVFGLAILILVEASVLCAGYVFKRRLDRRVADFVLRSQQALLRRLSARRQRVVPQDVVKSFTATIPSLGHRLVRDRWQRGRDVLVVLLVSLAALSLNYRCALALLGMLAANIILTLFMGRLHAVQEFGALRNAEMGLIGQWLHRLPRLWDLGRSHHEYETVARQVERINDSLLRRDRVRSYMDDLGRVVRTGGVVVALGLSVADVASGNLSTGSLWAIVILVYRINGPLSALSRAAVLDRRNVDELRRLKHSLFRPQSRKAPSDVLPGRLSRLFDAALKSGEAVHFSVAEEHTASFMEALRAWLMRIPRNIRFLVLEKELPPIEEMSASDFCVVADVIAPDRTCKEVLGLEALRERNPQARYWWVGPTFWMEGQPGKHYFIQSKSDEWDPKIVDFSDAVSKEQTRAFLERWERWNPEARELARDFRRCARLNVNATIAHIKDLSQFQSSQLRAKIRLTDHLLILPDGSAILGLMGTSKAEVEPALFRLLGDEGKKLAHTLQPFFLTQRTNKQEAWDSQIAGFERQLVQWLLSPVGGRIQLDSAKEAA